MEEPLEIYNYGSSSGLQLILHVTHEQAVDLLNHEIGVRVVVHDPHDLPFVAEYGINLRPRDMSAVEVTLSTIERLGPPWGSCIEKRRYTNYEELPGPYSILNEEVEFDIYRKKLNLNSLEIKMALAVGVYYVKYTSLIQAA
ncbi:amiloride-sensitive sodium channel subunit beta [Trichonephila inaurata madagascariensis]|uniref:Amiloride-sensitive sodium channel subunit beta n=1 Tax=Trichonephila inaurata madagascariensis TaxID=2747483 RepID=A0A8X6XAW9_9ARAC|nr:amiloride-sensitive sodium channel subunit beta [Trichonephila inaurata madagascariensis]